MAKDRLIVNCDHGRKYRLTWWIAEDDDLGGSVGEMGYSQKDLDKIIDKIRTSKIPSFDDLSSLECAAAHIAALTQDPEKSNFNGFYWDSEAKAKAALKVVKAAIRAAHLEAKTGRKMPDWAIQAQAAGWKPPKNWKP